MPHFGPSWSCLCVSFRLGRCLFLGVPLSLYLLDSIRHGGGESGLGKSEKGEEEWHRTRDNQTERVGGWRRKGVKDMLSSL
jgi:hypothetical protein